jgi:uncharacterized protein (DUF2141 family)
VILVVALLLADAAAGSPGAPITIAVRNVRNNHGRVRVDVCPRERFLADGCRWHATAPAVAGTTTVTVAGVPPGNYAAQAFHDENSNDRIDRGIFGIPREGVGFSRDARIVMSPPRWNNAEFTHGAGPQSIGFSLRYFLGPGSPEAWRKRNSG